MSQGGSRIGIMNIMLVSVTERRRVIGLRQAVGAQAGDVLPQFIVEAVVISVAGAPLDSIRSTRCDTSEPVRMIFPS